MPSGTGERCWGYASDDGAVAFCTRSELSGALQPLINAGGAYAHHLVGSCPCGRVHGDAPLPARRTAAPRRAAAAAGPDIEPALLDAIYWRYLTLCRLRPEHERFYRDKGSADLIAARWYRFGSLPRGEKAARDLVDALVAEFGRDAIERTPGFWPGRRGTGTHTATATDDAAVIPCWGADGRIVGMVRHTISGSRSKYRYFQGSRNIYCYAAIGLAQRVLRRVMQDPPGAPEPPCRELIVTEGIRKAYVAMVATHCRMPVFGMPGAFLGDPQLAALRAIGPHHIHLAIDADKRTNPDVVRAREANWLRLKEGRR